MSKRQIAGVAAGLAFIALSIRLFVPSPEPEISAFAAPSLGDALWRLRPLDVLLQIFIITAGVFGILTLVKEK